MRVIITGGGGLIGRPLAAQLTAAGHEVVVLSRQPERLAGLATGVRAERWDGRTAAGWGPLVEGAGAIVNLAGASLAAGRWTAARKAQIRDSRRLAGEAVTEAIGQAAAKPAVLLQASAVGYYGPGEDEPLKEDAPNGADFPAQVCRDWEASTAAVEDWGVRRCVLRTGVVLSTGGGALPHMALPFRFFAGGPVGSGRQWLPWIHMADQVGAIHYLLDHEAARGVFNLSAPQPVTNKTFAQALGRALGRPAFIPAPAIALRLLFGEMSGVVLEGQRAVPEALVAAGYRFRFETLDQALQDLYG